MPSAQTPDCSQKPYTQKETLEHGVRNVLQLRIPKKFL